jgi:ABC-type polysaccharide/polyol phosphate transport system ATPase subunit
MRSVPAPLASGPSGADPEAAVVAESVSKSYPGRRVLIFPPVVSIFDRDLSLFKGRRSSAEAGARGPAPAVDDYGLDDGDDDEDDEDDDERDRELVEDDLPPSRARPDEMFWALKDISFSVRPGRALGVLGDQGAGKSTLIRILGGRAFPTEGRVLVGGTVAPLAAEVQKALALSGREGDNLVQAGRLLGAHPQLVKQHLDEIEELAQPLLTPDGDPARGARLRLAAATTVILPADVILFDDVQGLDAGFVAQVMERLRERVRAGSALVLASRDSSLVQQLCDEVILLHEGSIVESGEPQRAAAGYEPAANGGQTARRRRRAARPAIAQGEELLEGQEARVPTVVAAFNASAALISAEVQKATGMRSKRFDADEELSVEIRLETALPDTEVQCAVCFTPRGGETSLHLELPEPLRLARPGTYVLVARVPPGTLRSTGYEVRTDATVASRAQRAASVIARDVGRIRIVGDELDLAEPAEAPVTRWDGRAAWPIEAEWSIRQEPPRL